MLKKIFIVSLLSLAIGLSAEEQIVLDVKHHLEWQDNNEKNIDIFKMAKGYCKQLDLGSYNDWRLPTKNELVTLSKDKELKKKFQYMTDNVFWSSDTNFFDAVTVFSGNGFSSFSDKCDQYATICVRSSSK